MTDPAPEIKRAWSATVEELGLDDFLRPNVHFGLQQPISRPGRMKKENQFPACVATQQGDDVEGFADGTSRSLGQVVSCEIRNEDDESVRLVYDTFLRNLRYPAMFASDAGSDFGLDLVIAQGQPVKPRLVALVQFAP